jgi:hypothetical protein
MQHYQEYNPIKASDAMELMAYIINEVQKRCEELPRIDECIIESNIYEDKRFNLRLQNLMIRKYRNDEMTVGLLMGMDDPFLNTLKIEQLKNEPIDIEITETEQNVIKKCWQIVYQFENVHFAYAVYPFFLMKPKVRTLIDEFYILKNNFNFEDKPLTRLVHWYWGESNCGKTYFVEYQLKMKIRKWGRNKVFRYSLMNNSSFFEGYEGQPYAFVDDIRHETMAAQLILSICNFIDTRVSVKGSSRVWNVKELWFSSLFCLEKCFPFTNDQGGVEQFEKRVSINIHFEKPIGDLNDAEVVRLTQERYVTMINAWKDVEFEDNFDRRKITLQDF